MVSYLPSCNDTYYMELLNYSSNDVLWWKILLNQLTVYPTIFTSCLFYSPTRQCNSPTHELLLTNTVALTHQHASLTHPTSQCNSPTRESNSRTREPKSRTRESNSPTRESNSPTHGLSLTRSCNLVHFLSVLSGQVQPNSGVSRICIHALMHSSLDKVLNKNATRHQGIPP